MSSRPSSPASTCHLQKADLFMMLSSRRRSTLLRAHGLPHDLVTPTVGYLNFSSSHFLSSILLGHVIEITVINTCSLAVLCMSGVITFTSRGPHQSFQSRSTQPTSPGSFASPCRGPIAAPALSLSHHLPTTPPPSPPPGRPFPETDEPRRSANPGPP